jgi:hypothetical protein
MQAQTTMLDDAASAETLAGAAWVVLHQRLPLPQDA